MRVLFVISVVCFLALAWAVLAMVRHARSNARTGSEQRPGHREFEFSLRDALDADIERVKPRPRALDGQNVIRRRPGTADFLSPLEDSVPMPMLVHRPESPKSPATPYRVASAAAGSIANGRMADTTGRKSPQPVRLSGLHQRLDRAYFNKDLGDLTDPYEPPLRANGSTGPRTSNTF